MAHISRICTKTLMSTWPHAWVPTPKITSFADPQSARLGPSLPTGERPDRGPWSVTPCHPGDTACSTVIARRSALVVAARSERWRRTRRVSEHHRHPRGRRRRSAPLQSSTLRPSLSPAAQSCRQRGGSDHSGGGLRRRCSSARGCYRHGQGAGRAIDELVASHPSSARQLAFEWRRHPAAGATDASVGRSAWQVASRMGALVLGHRRFLCDDRVFEPLALSRLVCLPAAMPDMPLSVLTGSLAPCSWHRWSLWRDGSSRGAERRGARASCNVEGTGRTCYFSTVHYTKLYS